MVTLHNDKPAKRNTWSKIRLDLNAATYVTDGMSG